MSYMISLAIMAGSPRIPPCFPLPEKECVNTEKATHRRRLTLECKRVGRVAAEAWHQVGGGADDHLHLSFITHNPHNVGEHRDLLRAHLEAVSWRHGSGSPRSAHTATCKEIVALGHAADSLQVGAVTHGQHDLFDFFDSFV